MNFLHNLFQTLFGGNDIQPAKPGTPLQDPALLEDIQPATGPVPIQNATPDQPLQSGVNPMDLSKFTRISPANLLSGIDQPIPLNRALQPERMPYTPGGFDPNMPNVRPWLDQGGVPFDALIQGSRLTKAVPRVI